MMGNELRIIAVLGLLAMGVIALLGSFALLQLLRGVRHLKEGVARRALPSLRGDTRDLARLIDHKQAAWRLRC